MNSSHASAKLSLIDAFSLHSVCVPVINMHKGRVHDVTHCFNLEKKCVPPYLCLPPYIIQWIVVSIHLEEHNRHNRLA